MDYVEIAKDLDIIRAIAVTLQGGSDDLGAVYQIEDILETLEKESRKQVRESGRKTFDLMQEAGYMGFCGYRLGEHDKARNDLQKLQDKYNG